MNLVALLSVACFSISLKFYPKFLLDSKFSSMFFHHLFFFLILILAFTSYLHKVKTFFVLEVLILCRRNLHTGEKPNFFGLQVNRLKSCKITHFNFRPSAVANEETCLGRSCAKKRKDVLMGCVLVGIRSCLPGGQFVSGDTHYRHHSVHCLLPCF